MDKGTGVELDCQGFSPALIFIGVLPLDKLLNSWSLDFLHVLNGMMVMVVVIICIL